MTIQYVNTGFILSLISDDSKGTTIFLLVLPQNCLKVNKRDAPVQKCKIRPFGCLVYRLYSFFVKSSAPLQVLPRAAPNHLPLRDLPFPMKFASRRPAELWEIRIYQL